MKKNISVICCLIMSLIISGCGPGQLFGLTVTPTPTTTPTLIPPTATPTLVHTATSRPPTPTATLNPQAAQARSFAEPILNAIAEQKPDFEDDFSAVDKRWIASGWGFDQIAIENGRLRIFVKGRQVTHVTHPAVAFNDFVLTVDAMTEVRGANDTSGISWRGGQHTFALQTSQFHWATRYCHSAGCDPDYASGENANITVGKVMRIMIVAKGSAFALYLDGNPLAYVDEPTRQPDTLITLFARSDSESELAVIAFDNFKIWNLDNVPGLP
jgi:hypothetical protein